MSARGFYSGLSVDATASATARRPTAIAQRKCLTCPALISGNVNRKYCAPCSADAEQTRKQRVQADKRARVKAGAE